MMREIRTAMAGIILSLALIGCRATPAPSVGFANPSVMKRDPNIPYNKYWQRTDVDWNGYYKIYVADVGTSYMLKTTDWQKGERKAHMEKDVHDLAVYMRGSLIKAFREDPKHRFQVIDHPVHDPHALVLEVTLVEVVPSKILLNTLGFAPFGVGPLIRVVRTIANDESAAAFEARTRDAATDQVVMLAADRESQQFALIDVRGLSWYGDVRGIMNDWSREFVQVADKAPGEKVSASSTFRLLPW